MTGRTEIVKEPIWHLGPQSPCLSTQLSSARGKGAQHLQTQCPLASLRQARVHSCI